MSQYKRIMSVAEASDKINKEFGFKGKELISNHTLRHWRALGLVNYGKHKCEEIRHKPIGVSEEELESLIGFAYLNHYLGISYKKVIEVQKYLSNPKNIHLKVYLNLYKPPLK